MVDLTVQHLITLAKSEIEECDLSMVEKAIQDGSHLIVDVRELGEFSIGHIMSAINVPRGVLEFRIDPG